MKQFFTLLSALFIGSIAMAQVAFQSDLSSWASGLPIDWDGTSTNLSAASITEVPIGATYGTSMAQLVNTGTGHKRFSTQPFAVVPSTTYEITVYVAGVVGEMRTGYYDVTNSAYNPTTSNQYNNYVDIAAISGGATLGTFTQQITTDVTTASIEVILSFRGTDANGVLVDSVSVSIPSNPPMPTPHTVVEIQNNGGNPSAFEDSLTITSGVVTAIKAGEGYWIQDGMGAWTGIYVEDDINTPSRGDSITVTGKIDELFGVTQIALITNYMLETAPVVPISASVVSSSDVNNLEDWEGVLVQVQAAECITEDANFGQWTINNGSSPADSVLVDDDLFSFAPTLGVDYNVTGIGHYSFSASKLLPRDMADITTGAPSAIKENNFKFAMFPNPATNQVVLSGVENSVVTIFNISGSIVYSSTINGLKNIDISNYSSGIYLVKIAGNTNTSVQKLIVK